MSRVLGLIMSALVLSAVGCGGGGDSGDDGDSAEPPASSPSSTTNKPRSAANSAVDANGDLSEFVCQADQDGEWNASGVITNSASRSADYRVTVVVSEGPGVSVPGKRRVLTDLAPGRPETFDVEAVPDAGDTDSTCQVEVLRLP